MTSAPEKIGRFEIRRELGRGMMGVVYEAHDPVLTRTVALKTVNPALAAAAEELDTFERRFETEARIAARLSHPNIVVVHDVGRDRSDPEREILYIALEHLQGESLAHVLKRGERLPWRTVLDIGRQLADALHHAHALGVVHRDIKPANVMLLPSGQAKLMDFGIARLEASQLTAAGQFFGTPLFMCPEQASSEHVDGRGDIFSLGSVLYTLLTGRHAFAANTIAVIVYRVANEDPPPPSTVEPSLPPEVDLVLARCLAKRPADRYADAGELSEDLSDVLEGRPPRHAASAPSPHPAPRRAPDAPELVEPLGPIVTVDPTRNEGGSTRTLVSSALPDAGRRRQRRRTWLGTAAAVWVAALAIGLAFPQLRALARPLWPGAPDAARAEPAPTPEPTPEPTPVPATVVVDFRHPVKAASLQIWMDDEEVLGQRVRGKVSKDLLLVKVRNGVFTDVLDVAPGTHTFRVETRWDDDVRTETIPGRVYSGQTYRLEIRLGRIKKDLSLKWTR
jgi:serine/threonine protein kinase